MLRDALRYSLAHQIEMEPKVGSRNHLVNMSGQDSEGIRLSPSVVKQIATYRRLPTVEEVREIQKHCPEWLPIDVNVPEQLSLFKGKRK